MINRLKNMYYNQTLTVQITVLIILVFITFFVIQFLLNATFFPNFYEQRQLASFENANQEYVANMNEVTNNDYYSIMDAFIQNNNAVSVMIDENFQLMPSNPSQISVNLNDSLSGDTLNVTLNDYMLLSRNDSVFGVVKPLNEETYVFTTLFVNQSQIFENVCLEDTCQSVNGFVVSQEIPNITNHAYATDVNINYEVGRLSTSYLAPYEYDDGWRYASSYGPRNTMVYINPIGDEYILTVFNLQNTSNIVSILANYQNYVYLSALILILLYSFRIGKVASNPILKIEQVAQEISSLNFEAEALEFKSKEATSLSKSINSLSKNLKNALVNLNQNNQELMALYRDQSQQVDLKKQLVSTISHELKTPLMIVQVTIQGIIDGIIPEDQIQGEFQNVLDEVNRSTLLIQDLLEVYRLDSKELPLKTQTFDFSKMVSQLKDEFNPLVKQRNFNYLEDIDSGIEITADPKLMHRAISNFMTNAIKYSPNGETIEVQLKDTEDSIAFKIINYGVTLDDTVIQNIWTPFYRGDNESFDETTSKSSGIGLYLVSEILKAHSFDYQIENLRNAVQATITIKKPQDMDVS